ncbi:WD repeat protein [Microthyrium microscopicum]|uniref:Ribosome assembly protein 4 n=1 Tax=Microthyrium microscopicum TaxID=703497 RepID=A0A6A6U1A1_9PEZI|nr:WD repeat protein [Microthyrium microscopicum]
MATVVPPPSKRRKLQDVLRATTQHVPEDIPTGSVRIRFIDRSTNQPIGPAVAVPLQQSSIKNLDLLANSLQNLTDPADRLPHRFFYSQTLPDGTQRELALSDNTDIYTTLIKTGLVNTEDELVLAISPQAVFRVKPVARCSSAISGHAQPILTAQFSPANGSQLCTGSGDNTARIWDCDTGTPLHTLKGHTGWVLCIAYAPDNTIIATGSHDSTLRLWEAKTGKPLGGPLKGHTKFIRSLSWEPYHLELPGRPRIASSSKDSTVRVWDVVGRKTDFVLSGHKASVACVKWGGTGLLYTASQDRTIKIWDSKDGRLIHSLETHAHWVNHLALSTDFVLRTGFHDHTSAVPKTVEDKRKVAKERFTKAATVNKKLVESLASASDDNVIYLWDPLGATPTKPVARMLGHQKPINHVTFSPDGMYIASSGFDNHVKLWNARDGKFMLTLRGHVAPVYQSVFSPDSRLLVSGSKDTTLKCWDVASGKLHTDLPGHQDEVYAVDWSPDGEKVGSGGKDKAVRLWRH